MLFCHKRNATWNPVSYGWCWCYLNSFWQANYLKTFNGRCFRPRTSEPELRPDPVSPLWDTLGQEQDLAHGDGCVEKIAYSSGSRLTTKRTARSARKLILDAGFFPPMEGRGKEKSPSRSAARTASRVVGGFNELINFTRTKWNFSFRPILCDWFASQMAQWRFWATSRLLKRDLWIKSKQGHERE